jgi:ribosomal protein S18 acetylase RimI-like enzyme
MFVKIMPGGMNSSVAARTFDVPALTQLFNAGFSGYRFPMWLSGEAFCDHVAFYDIDLDSSQVVVDDSPVAFALVGRRRDTGWIGGMGTTPSHRERGLGERALVATIVAAIGRGCSRIGLEVLDTSEPAIQLYRKCGFEVVRDLAVWSLPPTGRQPDAVAVNVEIGRAQRWIAAHTQSPEPWQRHSDTLAGLQRRGVNPRGLGIERSGELVAAAIMREQEERVAVVQIAAVDEDAATNVLLAAAEGTRTLSLANVPIDEPASRAMKRLGADHVAMQHEMALRT